jgi:hypothetical protein
MKKPVQTKVVNGIEFTFKASRSKIQLLSPIIGTLEAIRSGGEILATDWYSNYPPGSEKHPRKLINMSTDELAAALVEDWES